MRQRDGIQRDPPRALEPVVRPAHAAGDRWTDVRVRHLGIRAAHPRVKGRVRVEVAVYLGWYWRPANVLVEFAPIDDDAGDGTWPRRLHSTRSYRNGTYVFEALASEAALRHADSVIVRVRPCGGGDWTRGLEAITRTFDLDDVSAGWNRRLHGRHPSVSRRALPTRTPLRDPAAGTEPR